MEADTFDLFFWIILAIIALTIGIIGYLLGKRSSASTADQTSLLKKLELENAKLQRELETCLKNSGEAKIKRPKSKATAIQPDHGFDANAAESAMGKKVVEDDLKLVEGIGPKIQELFHNAGIKSWKALSEISANRCQEILNMGGKRYRIHDPASWPMQAKMAYEGHWKQLSEWQEKHRAGKY